MVDLPVYRQGSFKTLDFNVEASSITMGRRVVVHEYVNRDIPYAEDMGRRHWEVSVSVFFNGEDHLDKADQFQRALNSEGDGELVLPNRESLFAYCIEAIRREDTRFQKLNTFFDLTFVEAGEFQFPNGLLGTLAALLNSVADSIEQIVQDITAPFFNFVSGVEAVADAASRIGQSISGLTSIGSSFESLSDAIQQIGQSGQNTVNAINSLITLANFSSAVPPVSGSPSASLSYQQALEFDWRLRTVAILQAASLVTELELINRNQALTLRDTILSLLVQDISLMSPEEVALVEEVYRRVSIDFSSRIAVLPAFVRVDLGQSCPSVVAAHRVLCDWTREEELRQWNKTMHPLFMPQIIEAIL